MTTIVLQFWAGARAAAGTAREEWSADSVADALSTAYLRCARFWSTARSPVRPSWAVGGPNQSLRRSCRRTPVDDASQYGELCPGSRSPSHMLGSIFAN